MFIDFMFINRDYHTPECLLLFIHLIHIYIHFIEIAVAT